jgi:MFS family permease
MAETGSTAGAAVAPLIVVPIAVSFGWRAPFFVNAVIGLAWLLVCYARCSFLPFFPHR